MENLNLSLLSSSSSSSLSPIPFLNRSLPNHPTRFHPLVNYTSASRSFAPARIVATKSDRFARTSSSTENQTASVGVNPLPALPSNVGSPLVWVGVGFGLSALLSWVSNKLKITTEHKKFEKTGPLLSVDDLEKMMEDPTIQKMFNPYLPEQMRSPDTFKSLMQNPERRQQVQEMLNNMDGNTEQFDQLGLVREEFVSKITQDADLVLALLNPRIQQAITECSENPLSIAKYKDDKEFVDVFNKGLELFSGVMGSP